MGWEAIALADGSPIIVLGCQDVVGTSGSPVHDSTGTPHNGTMNGAFTPGAGPGFRTSLDPSASAFIQVANFAAAQLDGLTRASIEIIVKADTTINYFQYLASLRDPSGFHGWYLYTGDSTITTPGIGVGFGDGTVDHLREWAWPWDTGWHHIVATITDTGFSNTTTMVTVYIDAANGVATFGPTATNNGVIYTISGDNTANGGNSADPLRVLDYTGGGLTFPGAIAGFALYADELSPAQVAARFTAISSLISADSSTAIETSHLIVVFPALESAGGTDTQVPAPHILGAESATGVDAGIAANTVLGAESASGIEANTTKVSSPESAAGVETVTSSATIPFADSGVGAELTAPSTSTPSTDSGVGTESTTPRIISAEAATGAEVTNLQTHYSKYGDPPPGTTYRGLFPSNADLYGNFFAGNPFLLFNDPGAALETFIIHSTSASSETATAANTERVINAVSSSDSATGIESIKLKILSTDSGSAIDAFILTTGSGGIWSAVFETNNISEVQLPGDPFDGGNIIGSPVTTAFAEALPTPSSFTASVWSYTISTTVAHSGTHSLKLSIDSFG